MSAANLPGFDKVILVCGYLGSGGGKVPLITDAEKQTRRQKVRQGADPRYKGFQIVTYYDKTQEHRQVAVTQGDHPSAGALMRRAACRLRLGLADDKVAVVDGVEWMANQITGQSLPVDVIELDCYHLSNKVRKARRAVYGEEGEAGTRWAAVLHTAKQDGYEALRDALVRWKQSLRGAKKRKAAEGRLRYATDRRTMVAYPEYLAAGRQKGSGPMESMCKTATRWLRGSGMHRDGGKAEAVRALDALEQSGDWQHHWTLRLRPAG
jgi:hypothetical protein